MDKLSYLSAVQGYLLDLPESDIRAALDYYMEEIDARMREGLSEEEAVAQLPDPQTAAEQVLQSLAPARSAPPVETPRVKRRWGLLVLGLCLALAGAAGLLLTRGFRASQPFRERQAEIGESFISVSIELTDGALTVKPAADARCLLNYEESEQCTFEFRVEGGCLYITQVQQGASLIPRAPRVELLLPAESYKALDVRSGSGSVWLSGTLRAESFKVKTSSGSITCTDCLGQKISLESSGSIRASNLEAEQLHAVSSSGSQTLIKLRADKLSAEASSGSVRMEDTQAQTLSVSCSSGSLDLEDCCADDQIRLRSSSGSIRFEELDAPQISVEAGSGSIKGSVAHRMNFEASSGSGSVELPESDPFGGRFRAKTTSGSIRITVDG